MDFELMRLEYLDSQRPTYKEQKAEEERQKRLQEYRDRGDFIGLEIEASR